MTTPPPPQGSSPDRSNRSPTMSETRRSTEELLLELVYGGLVVTLGIIAIVMIGGW